MSTASVSTPGSQHNPGVDRITVTSETRDGRLYLSVDPWRAPVSRKAGTIMFRVVGNPGQRLMLVPKDPDAWDLMLGRPGNQPVTGNIVIPVKPGAPSLAAAGYSVVLETPGNGTIEIDPEVFICD